MVSLTSAFFAEQEATRNKLLSLALFPPCRASCYVVLDSVLHHCLHLNELALVFPSKQNMRDFYGKNLDSCL